MIQDYKLNKRYVKSLDSLPIFTHFSHVTKEIFNAVLNIHRASQK